METRLCEFIEKVNGLLEEYKDLGLLIIATDEKDTSLYIQEKEKCLEGFCNCFDRQEAFQDFILGGIAAVTEFNLKSKMEEEPIQAKIIPLIVPNNSIN